MERERKFVKRIELLGAGWVTTFYVGASEHGGGGGG